MGSRINSEVDFLESENGIGKIPDYYSVIGISFGQKELTRGWEINNGEAVEYDIGAAFEAWVVNVLLYPKQKNEQCFLLCTSPRNSSCVNWNSSQRTDIFLTKRIVPNIIGQMNYPNLVGRMVGRSRDYSIWPVTCTVNCCINHCSTRCRRVHKIIFFLNRIEHRDNTHKFSWVPMKNSFVQSPSMRMTRGNGKTSELYTCVTIRLFWLIARRAMRSRWC